MSSVAPGSNIEYDCAPDVEDLASRCGNLALSDIGNSSFQYIYI